MVLLVLLLLHKPLFCFVLIVSQTVHHLRDIYDPKEEGKTFERRLPPSPSPTTSTPTSDPGVHSRDLGPRPVPGASSPPWDHPLHTFPTGPERPLPSGTRFVGPVPVGTPFVLLG